MKRLSLSEPYLKGREIKYLEQCIKTKWLSGSGKYVNLFEKKIANYTSAKFSVGLINGTSALHLALKILGCKTGDEIIVPTLTFVATINSIIYNNCSPIFMDSDEYYNIDEEKTLKFLETQTIFKNGKTVNKKTKKIISALIVVHVWGNAAKFEKLFKYCKLRNIKIVEDASESLGTKYTSGDFKDLHTGLVGDIGCISFNTNKIITCGSGGMIVTNNKNYYKMALYLSTQAKNDPVFFIHNSTGYNYRLNNLNAAVGLAQFENFEKIFKKKQSIHKIYVNKINKILGLKIAEVPSYSKNNCWLNILIIDKNYKLNLNQLISKFSQNNIEVRPIWFLNHRQKMFRKFQKFEIKKSIKQIKSSLCLPSSTSLSEANIDRIVNLLK